MENILRKIAVAATAIASCCIAQTVSASQDGARTILTIGDNEISKQEFEYFYSKNSDLPGEKMSPEEYMDLFINFKLKVQQAKDLGYADNEAYKNEIAGYRKQLAAPCFTDDSLKNVLVEEEYGRLKEDIRLSHIMFRVDKGDTLSAYEKGLAVLERLDKGEDFAALAEEFSDDRATAQRGGELGFISGMTIVYPLETAAYECPVGQHTGLVRTRYGYHIAKVTDRRPSKGEISVAHIFIQKPASKDSAETDAARKKVYDIYNQLMAGSDFAALAAICSQDESNAKKGGQMPWLTVGHTNPYFDDVAFSLEKGEISQPLEAPYGWHIIKMIDKRDLPTIDELRKTIETQISRDERSIMIRNSFINKLKREFKYKEGKGDVICTFADEKITKKDLAEYTENNPKVTDPLNGLINSRLIAYADKHLEERDINFAMLLNEYRDGILLFNISSDSVWNKAGQDTLALKKFFEDNKEQYAWDKPRFKGRIIYCKTPEIKAQAEVLAKTVPADSVSAVLKRTFNNGNVKNVNVLKSKLYIKGNDPLIDYYAFGIGNKPVIKDFEDAFVIGEIQEKYPGSYTDVKGTLVNDYQKYLEEEWLRSLRSKYSVKVHYNVLKKVK